MSYNNIHINRSNLEKQTKENEKGERVMEDAAKKAAAEPSTMQIWDGSALSKEMRKDSKGWDGFHVLFTERTQFQIILESMKKKLMISYAATLAFLVFFTVMLGGAGILNFLKLILLSAAVPLLYGMLCSESVYNKVFDPSRDQGKIGLPEGMTWEDAVNIIRRGFAEREVEQITDTVDTVVFHSRKYGVYQIQNTQDGLKLNILSLPSKKEKVRNRYYLFGNMVYSQVISLLYPAMISAAQVEAEKKAVHGYTKRQKVTKLVVVLITALVAVWFAVGGANVDAIRSCGVSESKLSSIFSADATLDEIFDAFFDDSKWDHHKEDGQTIVTYSGDTVGSDGETNRFTFYFILNADDTFQLDRVTCNGETLDWLRELVVLNALDEYYVGTHTESAATASSTVKESESAVLTSSSIADVPYSQFTSEVESESEAESEEVWNEADSGDAMTDEDVDAIIQEVWYSSYPEYPDIWYGSALDYFMESEGYSWTYDAQNNVVNVDGSYITLDYRLGEGDYALHELHLTFYKDKYDRWMPRFNTAYPANDEYTDVRDFMDALYGFYQQSVLDAG